MFNRNRNLNRARGLQTWFRVVYLSNLVMIILLVLVYVFGLRIPAIANISLSDPVALLLGYAIIFILWVAAEYSGRVDQVTWLADLYTNHGLRWYDLGLMIGTGLLLYISWELGFASLPVWLIGGGVILNCLLSFFQTTSQYDPERIANQGPVIQPADDPRDVAQDAQPFHPQNPPHRP